MEQISLFFQKYMSWLTLPNLQVTNFLEILIIAFAVYEIMLLFKNTRAGVLLKGLLVLLLFLGVCYILQMHTILWLLGAILNVGIIALVVLFQPELRRALEQLGNQNFLNGIFDNGKIVKELISDQSINELVRACFEMGRERTGALVVLEREISLAEYSRTGIPVDGVVTAQLLINIFEKNTPLHDGAVIIRNDRVETATCYLPLSNNMELSKALGTRHRAGIGITEESDAVTLIVSEETGRVSVAKGGQLMQDVNQDTLRRELIACQNKQVKESRLKKILKHNDHGRGKKRK